MYSPTLLVQEIGISTLKSNLALSLKLYWLIPNNPVILLIGYSLEKVLHM